MDEIGPRKFEMKAFPPFLLAVVMAAAIACAGEQPTATPVPTATPIPTATPVPTPTPTPTPMPTATPDVAATVQAGVEATRTAEAEIEARVQISIAATKAALPPTPTPSPPAPNTEEKLTEEFFDCLESNLAVAGAFTSGYDGPLSEQVQTVLNAVGDVTLMLHDYGLFRDAMLLAMDSNPLVAPAVLAINVGCALIGGDGPSETPEPEDTPTPRPTATPTPEAMPTPENDLYGSKCEELASKIIELSQDKGPPDDSISEIANIEEITDNLLGIECYGLSHTHSGEANWIKFHQNRLGRYGYETLRPGDYKCEYLVPKIIGLSQSRDREILEIYDVHKLEQSDNELICRGTAKTSDREYDIDFYIEESEDSQLFYGYDESGSTK